MSFQPGELVAQLDDLIVLDVRHVVRHWSHTNGTISSFRGN